MAIDNNVDLNNNVVEDDDDLIDDPSISDEEKIDSLENFDDEVDYLDNTTTPDVESDDIENNETEFDDSLDEDISPDAENTVAENSDGGKTPSTDNKEGEGTTDGEKNNSEKSQEDSSQEGEKSPDAANQDGSNTQEKDNHTDSKDAEKEANPKDKSADGKDVKQSQDDNSSQKDKYLKEKDQEGQKKGNKVKNNAKEKETTKKGEKNKNSQLAKRQAQEKKEEEKGRKDLTSGDQKSAAAKKFTKTHRAEATQIKVKRKAKELIKELFKKNPFLFIMICAGIIVLTLILMLIIGLSGNTNGRQKNNYSPDSYDFRDTSIYVAGVEETIDMYIGGVIYGKFYLKGSLSDLTSSQKDEFLKAYAITLKSTILKKYKYDHKNKYLKVSYSAYPFCDIYLGCNPYWDNYYTFDYENAKEDEEPSIMASDADSEYISNIVDSVTNYVLVPMSFDGVISKYNYSIQYVENVETDLKNAAKEGKSFENIAIGVQTKNKMKIYDVALHLDEFETVGNSEYWWPVGSVETTEEAGRTFATGMPNEGTLGITSTYGMRTIDGETSFHYGIDISNGGSKNNMIIAARDGKVIDIVEKYSDTDHKPGHENYVKVEHEDGIITSYVHLQQNSVSKFNIAVGDNVAQGQVIGIMGNSGNSTGVHLHFGMRLNGEYLNPSEYVSADDPRTTNVEEAFDVDLELGSDLEESICKTLKSKNVSDYKIAGVLSTIKAVSDFDEYYELNGRLGIAEWSGSRLDILNGSCNNIYKGNCQLGYLIDELTNAYSSTLNTLSETTIDTIMDDTKSFCMAYVYDNLENENCELASAYSNSYYNDYVTKGCSWGE